MSVSRLHAVMVSVVMLALPAAARAQTPPAFTPTVDANTSRPGGDYFSFRPATADAVYCKLVCEADLQCRAWGYEPPEKFKDHLPTCWLKTTVPAPVKSQNSTSGIVRPDDAPSSPQAQLVRVTIHNPDGGKCIDVPNSNMSAGVKLQIYDCNGTGAQTFTYDTGNRHIGIGNLCIDVIGKGAPGDAIGLAQCNGNQSQAWNFSPSPTGQFTGVNGLCIDIQGGYNDQNYQPIQVWNCNGTPAQVFQLVAAPP